MKTAVKAFAAFACAALLSIGTILPTRTRAGEFTLNNE